ncbi:hypothetical protein [Myxosarcina sp. GI1(2024)]
MEATGGMEIDAVIKLTQVGLAVAVIKSRQALRTRVLSLPQHPCP